jgi:hypothetical protein
MMRVTATFDGPALTFNATVRGLPIYLDHDSLTDMASGDPRRRERFITVLRGGGDLLFSVTTAVELGDRQGKSVETIREFLDEVGPYWVPVELDTHAAAKRELQTGSTADACICTRFGKDYFTFRYQQCASDKLLVCDESVFRLGAIFDWMLPQRDSLRQGKRDLDAALIAKINTYRHTFERDPGAFDQALPPAPFKPGYSTTFTLTQLTRALVLDAKAFQLKKGDGIDYCHAVIAASFARAATLDKAWKRRIEALPKPNDLAKIYYRPELDQLVDDLEQALKILQARDGAAMATH